MSESKFAIKVIAYKWHLAVVHNSAIHKKINNLLIRNAATVAFSDPLCGAATKDANSHGLATYTGGLVSYNSLQIYSSRLLNTTEARKTIKLPSMTERLSITIYD